MHTLTCGTLVKDAIDLVVSSAEPVPVLDPDRRLLGVISSRQLLRAMQGGA